MTYYHTIPPSPELAAYVRFYWVLESKAAAGQPYVHRSMADGCVELLFHYQGRFNEILTAGQVEESFTAGLHGPSQAYRRFTIEKDFGIFGVYLYPYALSALFSVPAQAVSNQMPDLASFLGTEGQNLEERIRLAPDTASRVQILSGFLQQKLHTNGSQRPPAVFTAIQSIIRSNGLVNVPQLAAQTCLSTRQFERTFKTFSGFSPKLFSRIIRFQAALQEYGNYQKSLTDISYACGYYDQSHFIHDFKEFSGHHPRVYFSGKSQESAYKDC